MNLDRIYQSFLSMLSKYGLEKYCKTIRKTSEKAAPEIESIDVLYIDGNINEAISLQDVKLYLPKVRSGGYIWINDALWANRQSSLDLLLESCTVVKLIDGGNCILFKKREAKPW